MARLERAVRQVLAKDIQPRLPPGWSVSVGADGHAWVQVDQDGEKAANAFHKVGTFVILVENRDKADIVATLFERVRFPPGYTEARKKVGQICLVRGRGWRKALTDAVASRAFTVQEEYEAKLAAKAARAAKRKR